ncbi:protein C19orf12 homolog [Pollicipes pollicipes]|uniref:protein C19orf12 homolog n=1 Tax=Pollicipes pollicipes TaxID=41117 RepID=UPI001884F137|nr:protein C19orf12 homolog [Pollicipes pollicipes]
MPLDRHDCLALLVQLAEEEDLRVTVKGSAWGALVAGLGAFVGGVALGPPGLLLGGTAGGGAAYAMSRDQFRPAAQVIREMPLDRQRRLVASASSLVQRIRADDVITALAMLATGSVMGGLRTAIIGQVVHFLTSEMALQMVE